jgi:Phosphotransferase enzyme family
MTTLAPGPLEMFCDRFGVSSPFNTERIRAGRNSEVLLLRNRQERWILKHYYQHVSDRRDRLGTEFGFLAFLQDSGVCRVPRPLGADRDLGYGLYSFLSGTRPDAVASAHISQAAAFVREINWHRRSAGAKRLPKAADACVSWQDHLNLTESRLNQLLAMTPAVPLEFEAHSFVRDQLIEYWAKLKSKILREVDVGELADPLQPEDQMISPSDFGFHNTLENEGRLSFVDFEYAGWDDPAKLICDFICQPELPISASQGLQFLEELLLDLRDSDGVGRRVKHLLPVHRVKWCCIMLNEFKLEDRKRRSHAGVEPDGLLARQLGKAKQYFDTHLASTH